MSSSTTPRTRSLYDKYAEFNAIVAELEAKGREDLVRQGYDGADIRHSLEMDLRYGNQLVTTAVVFDINRVNGVADVLHLIRTFSDIYGQRYGAGSETPKPASGCRPSGSPPTSKGDVVKFESLDTGPADHAVPGEPPGVHFVDVRRRIRDTPVYDAEALHHQHVIHGPAIVTTENTTYLVEPSWRLEPTPRGAVWSSRLIRACRILTLPSRNSH